MSPAPDLKFEIGHVLFVDIVGYSKLNIHQQTEQIETLKQIVRGTEQFKKAEADGKLLRLPTGDGGALVFRTSPEAPALCALEIAKELKVHPDLKVRMGIHSGPVNKITDLNEQANIAGAGINMAQRVMDCGDAGHILLSRHVEEDLEHYPRWQSYLHPLGECEVKHGVRVGVVNLCNDEIGNPQVPKKFRAIKKQRARARWMMIATALLLLAGVVAAFVILTKKRARSTSNVPEKSIAVLPFENLSSDKENAYFADGVQDDILTDLAKVADLKVISRRSVAQYRGSTQSVREIGQALQVAYVLEGTFRQIAGKLRVTAQLIDTRTEAEKWAEKYERDVADVFAIQNQISQMIVTQLKAALSPVEKSAIESRPTQDEQAYDLYLRARALIYQGPGVTVKMAQADFSKAITLLEAAISRDPNFVLAYCLMSQAQLNLFHGEFYNYERLPKAKMAVDAALRINPQSGEAHLALAQYLYDAMHDSRAAASELVVAANSLPGDVKVLSLAADIATEKAEWCKALQHRTKALELDPRDPDTGLALVDLEIGLRRYADAEKVIEQMMTFVPQQLRCSSASQRGIVHCE